jgi:Fe-S oxidoreductase
LPESHSPGAPTRLRRQGVDAAQSKPDVVVPAGSTSGKVAIFVTCYGEHNQPRMVEDLAAVLAHNGVPVRVLARESCCGMPKLELGDLDTVEKYMQANLPALLEAVDQGWDLIAPIPSCVLMFKQELPLMFPGHAGLQRVKRAFFDPFEYLMQRHSAGLLRTDFQKPLGKIAWQVPCHQRVQNIGPKTRDVLSLVPGTEVITIERCSGHDGTYGVKKDSYAFSRKLARPVENRVRQASPDHFTSDCVMAGAHIAHGLGDGREAEHPLTLLRQAYGI